MKLARVESGSNFESVVRLNHKENQMNLRILSLAAAFLACNLSFAETNVITCSTELPNMMEGKGTISTKMEVLEKDDDVFARVTQLGHSYNDKAEILEQDVREGLPDDLTQKNSSDDFNMAEMLIIHAKTMENDPVFEGMFSTGIEDLSLVRSATLYVVGEMGNMGGSVIVDAKDADGNSLGVFLGGFLVTPCE